MVDEHPDSINDAALANACTGADAPGTAQIIDFPANYHNGACGFNFADGHAEIHHWQEASTLVKVTQAQYNGFRAPKSRDIQWMIERSSAESR